MIDLDGILGTIQNQILTTYNADVITGYTILWDIPYIVKSCILILSLWFMYKCILSLLHKIGGVKNV